jgi:CMP/dCMP kinase
VRVIAIDGPSGSGKSTVARAVADRLGLGYLDTGAMYRAVAFEAMRRGIDPEDRPTVAELSRQIELKVGDKVTVDGTDATIEIRSPEVTRAVSIVAANPEVRSELVARQREWADAHDGGVVEGRDIGTVVFPDADVKVFLDASPEERVRRRLLESRAKGDEISESALAAQMKERDDRDSTRSDAPLAQAPDAVYLDSTGLTEEQVAEAILKMVRARVTNGREYHSHE